MTGRLFTSFDDAWQFFLNRKEELEDFFAPFPEDERFLVGWLLRLDDGLLSAVQRVQEPLSRFDWITLQPNYFLHTGIGGVAAQPRRPSGDEIKAIVERARRVWAGVKSFDITYPRLNCFHEAVVAEIEGDGPRSLVSKLVEANYWSDLPVAGAMRGVQLDTFLPHLTLATVNRPTDPRLSRTRSCHCTAPDWDTRGSAKQLFASSRHHARRSSTPGKSLARSSSTDTTPP